LATKHFSDVFLAEDLPKDSDADNELFIFSSQHNSGEDKILKIRRRITNNNN
jgi:hypothetical protein